MATAIRNATDPALPAQIGPQHHGLAMLPAEFDAIENYDDNYRYELIHGVLVVTPIPSRGETDPNDQLGSYLRVYRQHHEQGKCLDRTLPEQYVYVGDHRRRADRVIWIGLGHRPNARKDVPTIVVEFASGSQRDFHRDYIEKRAEYMSIGVQEYWIIDRFRRTMTVDRPSEPRESVHDEHTLYTTPLIPGFELPLAETFSIADEWQDES